MCATSSPGGGRSEELDWAGSAVEAVDGGTEAAAEHATGNDRQLDRQLQQIRVEQHLMLADALAGVAVETTALVLASTDTSNTG